MLGGGDRAQERGGCVDIVHTVMSKYDPPCEQVLTAMGKGSSVVVMNSSTFCFHHCHLLWGLI